MRTGNQNTMPRLGMGLALTVSVAIAGLVLVTALTVRAEVPPAPPYRPPNGPQTGPPPAPNMPRARGGSFGPEHDVTITAGRTGFNDRELVLLTGTLQGNRRPSGPDDGCGAEVWVDVIEDRADAVVLRARAATARRSTIEPPFGPPAICPAVGLTTYVVTRLPTPLAGRLVIDATHHDPNTTEGVPVEGGHADPQVVPIQAPPIRTPGWLPAGYELQSESGYPGSWSFAYGPSGPTPRGPNPERRAVTVSVGRQLSLIPTAPSANAPPSTIEESINSLIASGRPVEVGGHRGALLRNVTFLPVSVVWWSDGLWHQVTSPRESPLSDDDLLRIAQSLAPI